MISSVTKASMAALTVFAAMALLLQAEGLPVFRGLSMTEEQAVPIAAATDSSSSGTNPIQASLASSQTSPAIYTNSEARSNNTSSNQTSNDDVSISLIAIASGQRSSSTYLSHQILGNMSCHLSLNEILDPPNSRNAWEQEGKELMPSFLNKSVEPADLASFILRAGKRRCQKMLQRNQQTCDNHCWVNYKHFSIHLGGQEEKHTRLWDSLRDRLEAGNNQPSTFAMLVLERNVEERWRSTWFAQKTGDWDVKGLAEHKEKLAAAEIPGVSADFRKEHDEWFQMVRAYTKSSNARHQHKLPSIDLSFEDVTTRPAKETQALVQRQIIGVGPIH